MITGNLRTVERWYTGEWITQPLDENDFEYNAVLNVSFPDKLKYRLINTKPVITEFYDPLVDKPKAYLAFIQLAKFREWKPDRIIKNVLNFTNEYGPLWDGSFTHPLTIETILYEADKMALSVKTYKELTDYENMNKPITDLRSLIIRLQKTELKPAVESHLVQTKDGLTTTGHSFSRDTNQRILPTIKTDEEIVSAARAFIINSVNEGLVVNPIILNLNFQSIKKSVSPTEGWVPSYIFTDLLSVLWLQFYLDILNKSRLYECENPKCRIMFVPIRSDQKYHDTYCKNSVNVLKNYYAKRSKEGNNER